MPATEIPLAISDPGAFMDGPETETAPAPSPPPTKPKAEPVSPTPPPPPAKTTNAAPPAEDKTETVESLEALEEPKPGHWKKLKVAYKQEREQFQAKIKNNEDRIREFETKLKSAEDAQSKAPSPQHEEKVRELEAKVKELHEAFMVTDVTSDPQFKAHYQSKTDEQMQLAKDIVGDEKFAAFEKLSKLPEGEYKDAELEQFVSELPVVKQARFGGVLNDLARIAMDRSKAIKEAESMKGQRDAKMTEQRQQALANRDKMFATLSAEFQDIKTGFPAFQPRDGNAEWNKGVEERLALAKSLFTGEGIKDRKQLAQAAFHAAAFPAVIEAYKADMTAKDETIGKLEAQVKALSAAQPGTGATSGAPGEPPKKERFHKGMQPFEVENAFAALMEADAE